MAIPVELGAGAYDIRIGSGLLAEAGDPQALADAMARLIRDPRLRERLGAAGRQRVARAFRFDDGIDRLQDRFNGLAGLAAP